ncbi:MAG: sporulation protein YqfD [Clostridia bacterium]|nr:sporulation protein YqfD [Clostridia bacterium]
MPVGEVEAKVWYFLEQEEELEQEEKIATQEKEKKYGIILNEKRINFYKRLSNFEKYDTIVTKNKFKITNNFYLPIEIEKITNYEYKLVKKEYSEEELQEKILKNLEEQIAPNIKDKEIINRNFSTEKNGNKLKVKLLYEVIEKIGVEEKLVS